jgi:hypothetical protein
MRRNIITRKMIAASPERQARKIAAECAQEVGPYARTSAPLPGVTLQDADVAINGTGRARNAARQKIMAARRIALSAALTDYQPSA